MVNFLAKELIVFTESSHFQADTRLSVLMSGAIHKSLRCSCKQACRAS